MDPAAPSIIRLGATDLGLAAVLLLAAAWLTHRLGAGVARSMIVAAARAAVQLTLIGLVLKVLFGHVHAAWVALLALFMLAVAVGEVRSRQRRPLAGWWGYSVATLAMFVGSFTIAALALAAMVAPEPWYHPRYAIPLLGMLLGNTMTGVALALDRVTQLAWDSRESIENRLMLGARWHEAIGEVRTESLRASLIPIVNAMAAAGVVSLPGMMTGQILAGVPPTEAVKYQILIVFLIGSTTALGAGTAVWLASRRLFDHRERLRLDRLASRPR